MTDPRAEEIIGAVSLCRRANRAGLGLGACCLGHSTHLTPKRRAVA